MEAAGVEPASEMVANRKNYMLSPFRSLGARLRADKKARALARLDLGLRLRTEALNLSRKMSLPGPRAGSGTEAAA